MLKDHILGDCDIDTVIKSKPSNDWEAPEYFDMSYFGGRTLRMRGKSMLSKSYLEITEDKKLNKT